MSKILTIPPCPTCGAEVEQYVEGLVGEGEAYRPPTLLPCGHGVRRPDIVSNMVTWTARPAPDDVRRDRDAPEFPE